MNNFHIVFLLVVTCSLFGQQEQQKTPPAQQKADTTIHMDPVIVTADSRLSFGFSLRLVREETGNRILAMYIDRVQEESDAQRKGLEAGSQVLSIDGRAVSEYEGTFRIGSELHRILIGRPEGARVTLEVRPLGANTKPNKITIERKTIFFGRQQFMIDWIPMN